MVPVLLPLHLMRFNLIISQHFRMKLVASRICLVLRGTFNYLWNNVMIPLMIINLPWQQTWPSAKRQRKTKLLVMPMIGSESLQTQTNGFTAGRPLFSRMCSRFAKKKEAGWEISLHNFILHIPSATQPYLAIFTMKTYHNYEMLRSLALSS